MRRLYCTLNVRDAADELARYIERKEANTRDQLKRIEGALQACYAVYIGSRGDCTEIGVSQFPRGTSDGDLLYGCYSSGRGPDDEAVRKAQAVATKYCPYCGMQMPKKPHGHAHERDHYLPRSKFPEFSVLSINLVVACHDCNSQMRDEYETATKGRLILHPYFDDCLSTRLLQARAINCNGTAQIEFGIRIDHLHPSVAEVVASHSNFLDVTSRLSSYVVDEISRTLEGWSAFHDSLSDVVMALSRIASSRLALWPNDPLGIAYEALSISPELGALLQAIAHRGPNSHL